MSRVTAREEIARARLAYITAGDDLVRSPRHAREAGEDDTPERPTDALRAPTALPGWPAITRRHVIAVMLLLLCGIGIAVASLTSSRASTVEASPPSVHVAAPEPTRTALPKIRVHVLGAVGRPGVVELDQGSIVQDALATAGGLLPDADPGELNLAAPLTDGQQVVVGTDREPRGEVLGAQASTGGDSGGARVNLNTATQAQLEGLPGVGPVLAAAILAHRQDRGTFTSVAQLQEVSGIGPKSYARLEPLVTV